MTKWEANYASCLWMGLAIGALASAITCQRPFFALLFAVVITKTIKIKQTWRT